MARIDVTYDGRIYTARQRGTAGRVFADTAAEAVNRAAQWRTTHTPTAQGTVWDKKKRTDGL
jgi:hypothetical protein